MSRKISPNDLIAIIGKPTEVVVLPNVSEEQLEKRNIVFQKSDLGFYESPELILHAESDGTQYCCLISAPAAVGKTALAKYLHAGLSGDNRHILHIPLKDEKIGDNYFSGLLAAIYPDNSPNEIIKLIHAGYIVLIFDGYDEVSMTESQIESNKRFIGQIVDSFSAFSEFPVLPIIFLFRSVFIDLKIFEAISQFSIQLRLEFFSEAKRRSFLRKYIESRYNTNCDSIIKSLLEGFEAKLSVANSESAAFFGHAIVLQAFGDYIYQQEETNIAKILNKITVENMDESVSVQILKQIIQTILDREVTKFSLSIFTSMESDFVPYPIELQEDLLTALSYDIAVRDHSYSLLNQQIDFMVRQKLQKSSSFEALGLLQKDELRSKYREELVNKIDHHPFIDVKFSNVKAFRNPIYFEYYLARYFSLNSNLEMDPVFRNYKTPSYFFAIFFMSFIKERNVGIYNDALYYMISLYLAATGDAEKVFSFKMNDSEDIWEISFTSGDINVENFYYKDSLLTINIPSGGSLQGFEIDGKDGIVYISGKSNEEYDKFFSIVDGKIDCSIVEFSGSNIKFDQLVINSREVVFSDSITRLMGADSISIQDVACNLKMSPHLENAYRAEMDILTVDPILTRDIFVKKLKRILLYFRKHGRGDFACYKKKYESRVLNKKGDPNMLLITDFLFEKGVLKARENLYYLNQESLNNYGISYIKQNEIEISGRSKYSIFDDWRGFSQAKLQ